MAETAPRPRVVIDYCTQCRWLLRAGWIAQELLTTFTTDIGELVLRPGTGGIFVVSVDDEVVWNRAVEGGFPDVAPLKRLVRDRVAPGRSLGHTDRAAAARASTLEGDGTPEAKPTPG
jgi:selenoprotein W-related protein